jgi:L-asparaginase
MTEEKVLIINTGGTFNKIYDPIHGELIVDKKGVALESIAKKWCCSFEVINIIGKDSLEMTNKDRLELLATIHQSKYIKVLIIHGTDTIHLTAEYLADADLGKQIVLTGAMVPYSIDPVEATANFASAYSYLQTDPQEGIYISMNGIITTYNMIAKNRKEGRFVRI